MPRILLTMLCALVLCGCGGAETDAPPGTRVILLRFQVGSASTDLREQGFIDVLSRTDLALVSADQYGGPTAEQGYNKTELLLNRFRGRVDGYFCPNESTTFGALQVIDTMGLAGSLKFVGFDSSEKFVEAMRAGTLHGVVLQDPFRMGEMAVKTLAAHIRGEKVPKRIDTGVYLATPENLDDARIKELLLPPYEEWLAREKELPAPGPGVLRIAMIPKGATHIFWKTIHAGAVKGAREAGNAAILWQGPLVEDDREEQIKVMENFIAQKVDAIAVAPLDDRALVKYVDKAMTRGIPVVIFDSDLKSESYVSFVATDNYKGGAMAGAHMAKLLGAEVRSPGAEAKEQVRP